MDYNIAVERINRYSGLVGQEFCLSVVQAIKHTVCYVAVVPSYADNEKIYAHNWKLRDENYLGILQFVDCKLMFVSRREDSHNSDDIEVFDEDFFIFSFIPWRKGR